MVSLPNAALEVVQEEVVKRGIAHEKQVACHRVFCAYFFRDARALDAEDSNE